ncbi:SDR family oxidoreductase [Vreelandella sp. TE19]
MAGAADSAGRGTTPEEIAQGIAWLLSDEASYVTGAFIDMAGGK